MPAPGVADQGRPPRPAYDSEVLPPVQGAGDSLDSKEGILTV